VTFAGSLPVAPALESRITGGLKNYPGFAEKILLKFHLKIVEQSV
jgi:hypothetical protein